ncbi:hypothetical protein B0G71_0069 [Paraburkholderia sp. BL27I4N3]|uniref:hypothetical protein n=1 Tax=Paraburkholderia sp. BL27I4N3 TaxID=1938805 RepID=UPI000E221BC7|nr:hypothetical protein [Paraburkholderia sp. BL27I4N3]REE17131.1 hypothetical protein B0G71_0069 [Paraburkholderia sp. BL27I4N3]
MKVYELLERLANADPEALVLVFMPYADAADGAVLGDVIVRDDLWNHESGLYGGRPYEVFYPGVPEEREPLYSNVKVERVKVVLIGEELGNFHLQLEV